MTSRKYHAATFFSAALVSFVALMLLSITGNADRCKCTAIVLLVLGFVFLVTATFLARDTAKPPKQKDDSCPPR